MVLFCNSIDYPMNIVCNWVWKVAVIFVIFLLVWWLVYPKVKDR